MNKPLTIAPIILIICRVIESTVLDHSSRLDTPHCQSDVGIYSLNLYGETNENKTIIPIIQQFLLTLILDNIQTTTQKTRAFPITSIMQYDRHGQRSGNGDIPTNIIYCYECQCIFSSIPQYKYESEHMITLSQFHTLIKNRLDLRRYPKAKIKSIGLALLPKKGNFRKWYFGTTHSIEGKEKITFLPYLCGEVVLLEDSEPTEVKELNDEQKRTLSSIGQQWNIEEFQHTRQPIDIGLIQNKFAFQNPMPNVVNLPIKMAGSDKMYVPIEYAGMEEALNKIFGYEKAINPSYTDNYAYLTIDKNYVRAGSSQSRFIYHVDGFQSADYTNNTVQRNYTVTDIVPIEFVLSPLETKGLAGEIVGNWFESFTHQSEHVDKMKSIPLHIYHYDGYQVHIPTQTMATTDKTTLRVSFTPRQMNQLGNGINPLIDEEWTYLLTHLDSEVTSRGEAI